MALVILNETFRNSVTVVDRLSYHLMAVKVDTGEVELRVVSAYAPQVGCSEEDLEQCLQSLEGEEVLLIGGDFNGHVGSPKDGFENCHAVEVSPAFAKMKSNQATAPDDIPTDVWKLLGDGGSVWLATPFNKIVAEGWTPDVWQTSVTVPIWKGKGDVAECTSYRPVRLLCPTIKVLSVSWKLV
ncbi:hypothetical protein RB195_003775 [Necator americanus]|uniref:Endonuclease/exonuclease/phosphatase domain-containing protein n=1 Tax=Necator americanus TaxID=51031 RepID=A0ABR1DQB8_NECAM